MVKDNLFPQFLGIANTLWLGLIRPNRKAVLGSFYEKARKNPHIEIDLSDEFEKSLNEM